MQAGVAELVATHVRRILAPNPSAMTGPGTNSYLIGTGPDLVLLDPGPDDADHIDALLRALQPGEAVSAIVVTHAHRDHSAAAPRLAAMTGAAVLAFGDARSGRSLVMQRLADAGFESGGEGIDHGFRPDRLLADGDLVPCSFAPLRVIHTPGHMGGHICLGFGDVLFSGDHAMGWASSLISPPDGDMGAYMASLARLRAMRWQLMLPGHGDAVQDVDKRLADLMAHRKQREAEVLAALGQGPATPIALTAQIYQDTPPALRAAASRNVLAHLIDLSERNEVEAEALPAPHTKFALREKRV